MQYHFTLICTETHAMQFPGNAPLTDDELDRLDTFLLDRLPDDDSLDDDSADAGIICASELDGLLTAIVSGPELISPSQWLPVVWGDFHPAWERNEDAQEIMSLCREAWDVDDEALAGWLAPIVAFTERDGWTGHDLDDKAGDALRDAIEPSVIAIHQYWLEKRRPPAPSTVQRKAQASVGRNDPCPCGSGRKFKKCCLQ